jgi:hypothetical protein
MAVLHAVDDWEVKRQRLATRNTVVSAERAK